jgi:hypothetical protein
MKRGFVELLYYIGIIVLVVGIFFTSYTIYNSEKDKRDNKLELQKKFCTEFKSRYTGINCIKALARKLDNKEICDYMSDSNEFQEYINNYPISVFTYPPNIDIGKSSIKSNLELEIMKCKKQIQSK